MTTLSKTGVRRLAEAEAKIERGLSTFWEVGNALMQIRDERLYRADFPTFEEYCQERWGMTRRRANQLVEAAQLGTMVPIENERQARALAPVKEDPTEVREIYAEAEKRGDTSSAGIARVVSERKVAGEPSAEEPAAPADVSASAGRDADAPALTSEGAGLPSQDGPDLGVTNGPAPSVPADPALKMHAHLSDRRKAVADWLAFDRHREVIDNMTAEQRADYRSFVHSVWQHASETLDYLDAPANLRAVQ